MIFVFSEDAYSHILMAPKNIFVNGGANAYFERIQALAGTLPEIKLLHIMMSNMKIGDDP